MMANCSIEFLEATAILKDASANSWLQFGFCNNKKKVVEFASYSSWKQNSTSTWTLITEKLTKYNDHKLDK